MAFASRPSDYDSRQRDSSSTEHKKGYKVVVESVLEEKKQLKSHVSYSEVAPKGYTFVPVGVPHLTEACKELARKRGLDILIVSAPATHQSRLNAESISHHVHRIGHHFPNRVVDDVHEALYDSNSQDTVGTASLGRRLDAQGRRLGLNGRQATAAERSEQIAGAIKELFPRIPDEDCASIVQRAFETGAKTVGNAPLPLTRRVQLAVLAHIRHVHTDYDILLRSFRWSQARQMVEEPCLRHIQKWRGETDEQNDELAELEKVLREVIIIDDSDNEDEAVRLSQPACRRSSSLEIIEHRTRSIEQGHSSVATPPSKKRRTSPPEYCRSISPPLRGAPPAQTDIISVRPERGPRPRQVLQLDEMTRRAESWEAESRALPLQARPVQSEQYYTNVHPAMKPQYVPLQNEHIRYDRTADHGVFPEPPPYQLQLSNHTQPSSHLQHIAAPLSRSPYHDVHHSTEYSEVGPRHNKRVWHDEY